MAVTFKDIEYAFDFVNFGQPGEHEAYLNIHTGETYWYSEFGDNEEELPEDIDDENKYIALRGTANIRDKSDTYSDQVPDLYE